MRICRKSTGPRESSLTAIATTSSSGKSTSSPTRAAQTSRRRFVIALSTPGLAQRAPDCLDHVTDFRVGHCRIYRQGARATENSFRPGKLSWLVPERALVRRMEVQWDEMHRGGDAFAPQPFDELIAADRQRRQVELQDVEMPGVQPETRVAWHQTGVKIGEAVAVRPRDVLTALLEFRHAWKLRQSQRRRDVGEVVLESEVGDLVIPVTAGGVAIPCVSAQPVQAHQLHPRG